MTMGKGAAETWPMRKRERKKARRAEVEKNIVVVGRKRV